MEKLLKFLGGWVRLRLFSREPERFLNLCAGKKILLWDLRRRDGCYEFSLSLKDFFRLRPAARKSGSRIRILDRRGMPFFFRKCRRRKAFFAGVFLCFLLMYLLSCRIWNIHVEGNYANSTGDILSFLDSIGVSHGIRRSRIDCAETASAVREAFPNVTWVSVRIRGTRLLVDIKENVDGYRESREDSPEGAWDLAAEKSGVVDSIITRQGVPLVEAGESCEAGDILVSGQIPIKSDSGEILRWEPVEADADVMLRWTLYYYQEFPRNYTSRVYEEKPETSLFLEIGGWRLDLSPDPRTDCDYLSEEHQVFLTENFALPIRYGTVTALPFTEVKRTYSEEEAGDLAEEKLAEYMESLEKSGVEILENHVKIEISDAECRSSGSLTVRSLAAEKVPSVMEEPETDTGKEVTE